MAKVVAKTASKCAVSSSFADLCVELLRLNVIRDGNVRMENLLSENLNRLMAHRRLSEKDLSDHAKVAQRTISDLRKGRSRPQVRTLEKLEKFFDTPLTERVLDSHELGSRLGFAHAKYGGYEYAKFAHLTGEYFLYRRSFDYDDGVVRSHLRICGGHTEPCLRFEETQKNLSRQGEEYRYDFAGVVAIVEQAQILQLRSHAKDNVLRKTINFRLSDNGMLLGVLLGLGHNALTGYFPVASPVAAVKVDRQSAASVARQLGSLSESEVTDLRILPKIREISKHFFAVTHH